jgi:hypothetical protein
VELLPSWLLLWWLLLRWFLLCEEVLKSCLVEPFRLCEEVLWWWLEALLEAWLWVPLLGLRLGRFHL